MGSEYGWDRAEGNLLGHGEHHNEDEDQSDEDDGVLWGAAGTPMDPHIGERGVFPPRRWKSRARARGGGRVFIVLDGRRRRRRPRLDVETATAPRSATRTRATGRRGSRLGGCASPTRL